MKNLSKIILIGTLVNQLAGVGEAGAIFLLITPGAAPAALGEAQVAKVDDAYASYFNPAGLAFLYDPDPSKDDYRFDLAGDNYLLDPSRDNYHPVLNSLGSENNGNYDFGEFFYDYGKDGMPNNLEPGYDSVHNPDPNNDDFDPITNPKGTETNGRYDLGENYQDFGFDRIKNSQEFGYSLTGTENNSRLDAEEVFFDFGIDGISSDQEPGYNPVGSERNGRYEDGELFEDTGMDGIFSIDEPDYDPRSNPDPNKDDYHPENNPKGKENNGIFDRGEIFSDTGSDGVENSLEPGYNPDPSGDDYSNQNPTGSEGNGRYDFPEKFLDFGSDGLIDSLEVGFDPIYNTDPSGDNYSDGNPDGTEGNQLWEIGEFFFDFGTDGLRSNDETGWNIDPAGDDMILDPNGDDYHPETNPNGTENNNRYDYGEQFNDFGIDGVSDGTGEEYGSPKIRFNPGGTEGNHQYDEGEKFLDFGSDGVPDNREPGYNPDPSGDDYHPETNPTGTENNGFRDEKEEFEDEKIRYATLNMTFEDSLFHFYMASLENAEIELDGFLAKSVKYDKINHSKNSKENSIQMTVFLKEGYRARKLEKIISKNIEYLDFSGEFGDSLNNSWDWVDTDKNGRFNWQDIGTDGTPDSKEIGYDPITNPDPAGDNYSSNNRRGTEKNGTWDAGEGDWHEPFNDFGNDNIASESEPGYMQDPYGDNFHAELNPNGTEHNFTWDPGEEFFDYGADKKLRYEEKSSKDQELVLMHVNWLPNLADDLYYEFLGYRKYYPGLGTFGGHLIFLNLGEQTRTDEYGNDLGSFNSNMWALALSFGTKLSMNSSIGVNMKIIQQNLIDIGTAAEAGKGKSTDFGFDVGYLWKKPRFNFGAAITNIGPKIDFIDPNQADPQPTNLKMGIYWELFNDDYNRISLLFDANKLLVAAYPSMDWDGDGWVGGFDEEGNKISDDIQLGQDDYGYNASGQMEYAHTDPLYKALITAWLDDWYLGGDRDMGANDGSALSGDYIIGGYSYNEDTGEYDPDSTGLYNKDGVLEKGNNDDRSITTEFEEMVYNLGVEYWYSKYFAIRGGYIYDYEGKIMVPTFGAGIRFGGYGFDFGYTSGEEGHPRANTMFFSLNMAF